MESLDPDIVEHFKALDLCNVDNLGADTIEGFAQKSLLRLLDLDDEIL